MTLGTPDNITVADTMNHRATGLHVWNYCPHHRHVSLTCLVYQNQIIWSPDSSSSVFVVRNYFYMGTWAPHAQGGVSLVQTEVSRLQGWSLFWRFLVGAAVHCSSFLRFWCGTTPPKTYQLHPLGTSILSWVIQQGRPDRPMGQLAPEVGGWDREIEGVCWEPGNLE